jgi:hypothetical protein
MPQGLLGVVAGPAEKTAADAFLAFAAKQKLFHTPGFHLVKRRGLFNSSRSAFGRFLSSQLAKHLKSAKRFSGDTVHQLQALRGMHEELRLAYKQAHQLLMRTGTSDSSIISQILPGEHTLAGMGEAGQDRFSQTIPADIVGLSAIWIHIAQPAKSKDGWLTVFLLRAADNLVLGKVSLPYGGLQKGWNRVPFQVAHKLGFGDAVLEFHWSEAGGPELSLAKREPQKFGTEDGTSLALKVETRLFDPSASSCRDAEYLPTLSRLPRITGKEISRQAKFIGGAQAYRAFSEELGGDAISEDTSSPALLMHGDTNHLRGVVLPGRVPAACTSILAGVQLPNKSASAFLMILAYLPKGLSSSEALKQLQGKVNSGEIEGHTAEGVQWSAIQLSGGEYGEVKLDFSAPSGPGDLILATQALTDRRDFGVTRWDWVDIYLSSEAKENLNATGSLPSYEHLPAFRSIRDYRLPDFGASLQYYKGPVELEQRSVELGFSPFHLDEDIGYLQTHPFENHPSVAILNTDLLQDATRLVCEVGTAHQGASDFIYVLGVLPAECPNKVEEIEKAFLCAKEGKGGEWDAKSGVRWSAVSLPTQEVRQLALELDQEQSKPIEAFLGAVSVDGEPRFAWCRWYSLLVEREVLEANAGFSTASQSGKGQ